MEGVGGLAARAICSVTLMLEKIVINEIVRNTVIFQLNKLTLDMKTLITDVKEKINTHMQKLPAEAQTNIHSVPHQAPHIYTNALINSLSHANLKLAARNAIRARQFMWGCTISSDVTIQSQYCDTV